ncbi:MAG: Gfo/Idh/MocA family oxidoreductase, partial [Atribacterota bacterium]
MHIDGIDLTYRPKLPVHRDRYGIGIVGTGEIVKNCHLPAYQMAGFRVVGISSPNPAKEGLAQEYGIPYFTSDYHDLIIRDDVEVVDISVPPHLQADIAIFAAENGKHLLCQKPLATTFEDAVRIVKAAERNHVKIVVNQNGRWDPAIQAAKKIIAAGLIGKPILATMELRFRMQWQQYYLQYRDQYSRMMILSMSIHHLDQFRFLFGDPLRVWASATKYENQNWPGDTIAVYSLEYPDGFIA